MQPTKRILIVAGEPSGDLHASNLVKELKKINSRLEFFGLGGRLSKEAGVEVISDIAELALIGAVEVLKKIFVVRRTYNGLLKRIDSTKVDLAILVDYPGFNLRLAKDLRKRSIPIVYYISPQVWAWGKGRIERIRECVKKIIVFFKFEEELYKPYGIDVEFVGHPLLDIAKATSPKNEILKRYGLAIGKTTIALLPGSREMEVGSLLKIMVSASKSIKEKLGGVQFIVAKYQELPMNLYEREIENSGLDIRIAESDVYNILGASDFAIVASGTATLESAIIGVPFIIIYKTNLLTYLAYRIVARIPFLGLVNIIAKKEVVPELVQFDATPERIANVTIGFLKDEKKKFAMREELKKVRSSLGTPGATGRAASSILPLLK